MIVDCDGEIPKSVVVSGLTVAGQRYDSRVE